MTKTDKKRGGKQFFGDSCILHFWAVLKSGTDVRGFSHAGDPGIYPADLLEDEDVENCVHQQPSSEVAGVYCYLRRMKGTNNTVSQAKNVGVKGDGLCSGDGDMNAAFEAKVDPICNLLMRHHPRLSEQDVLPLAQRSYPAAKRNISDRSLDLAKLLNSPKPSERIQAPKREGVCSTINV
eukprot:31705-Amphidinium_carterae.1